MRRASAFYPILLCCLLPIWLFAQGASPKKQAGPSPSENPKPKESKSQKQGCCRIKYEGGGIDYFPATEEECVAKPGFQSFQQDSALCFQSLWD
ncbi:hypothetical protein EHQ53_00510 [Leptospira langatensis]|uniref:Uncharacterized protein n=1 Tax=Leptospira langatensis TaxID=2484983 RepID=A0A5F1ZWW6_9LEPT|nr:hypothetical protein [Leptospira langatensis]TGJ98250.1 hypothetical protein EHO57_16655 [Leptospira langatensis]TGL43164.1 hypothetical protein EHQ53_00510 [Leptospira langatensis]